MSRQDIITSVAFNILGRLDDKVKAEITLSDNDDLFKYHFSLGVIIRQEYLSKYQGYGDIDAMVHDILVEISSILKSGVIN